MRFSYLLVSAAIVAATHESVSVASAFDNAKVSQGIIPDSEVEVESLNPKRLRRSYKVDDDEGEEERGRWTGYDKKWIPRVKQWVEDGKLPSTLKHFYETKNARGLDLSRNRKYDLFNAAFLERYPSGFNNAGALWKKDRVMVDLPQEADWSGRECTFKYRGKELIGNYVMSRLYASVI